MHGVANEDEISDTESDLRNDQAEVHNEPSPSPAYQPPDVRVVKAMEQTDAKHGDIAEVGIVVRFFREFELATQIVDDNVFALDDQSTAVARQYGNHEQSGNPKLQHGAQSIKCANVCHI